MALAFRGTPVLAQMRQDGVRQAVFAGGATVACLALFGLLFPAAALGAFRVWVVSPTFNHCFLVLPISLFMVWQRRGVLADANVLPDWRAAVAILPLSAAWLAATVAGVLEAQQFVVMTMMQTALLAVLGAAFYRKLMAPLLYLYFLVPSGAFLIPALQAFTARFAVAGLHVLHIPVFSNGAVIEIPAGTFAVAEACAGLRFLVAAVAFGVFFAVITYRSWVRRAAFIALSIFVPVIANGFRALGLIAAAQWIGSPQAALADHIIYGWVFFSLVLVLLVCFGQLFSDRQENDNVPMPSSGSSAADPVSWPRIAFVALACFVAAGVAPVAASFLNAPRTAAVPQEAPRVAPPWRSVQSTFDWRPVIVGSARSFSETFAAGHYRIDRFIALGGAGRRNSPVRSTNRDADERVWSFDAAKSGVLRLGGRSVTVRASTWLRGAEKRMVWSFYVVNGRIAPGLRSAKWDQLDAYLTGSPCLSAYVALSAVVTDEIRAQRAVESLLRATEPLRPYLCGSTKGRTRR